MKLKLMHVAALALLPGIAQAQSLQAGDPAGIAAVVQDMGYRASIETDGEGDPIIHSSAAGVNFSIVFYDCTENRDCESIQFSAGFDLSTPTTAATMNEWNRQKRYASAWIDDEGDPYLQYDVTMGGGGLSVDNFKTALDLWEDLLGDFQKHIDW